MARSNTKVVFFEGKSFNVFEDVYEPAEDTLLLAENLGVGCDEIVLDVGTGCGILAVISALKARRVLAIDVNPHAVRCTILNAEAYRVSEKMDVVRGDLFEPFKEGGVFDLILFNAPYVPTEEEEEKEWADRAWSGGKTGRKLIDPFVTHTSQYLKEGGRILLVQSTLSDVEQTLMELKKQGFAARILAEKKDFFETITLIEAQKVASIELQQKTF